MNIWLFNPFDALPWEGKPQRYATLATCLAERGHSVVHWSSGFSHTFKKRRAVPDDFSLEALPYSIELIDCPGYDSNVGLRRLWNHHLYGKGLVREGRRAVAEGRLATPDLILASMPPMEGPSAALRLKRQFGCKMVLDVMDAWPETLLLAAAGRKVGKLGSGKVLSAKTLLWPYYRMMRRCCREADAVCAQSQAFADYARRFGATGEIPVFYLGGSLSGDGSSFLVPDSSLGNGRARTKNEEPRTKNQERRTKNQEPQPPLRLLYLGSMGRVYDLSTLVEAVLQLLDKGQAVRLDLVGEGEQRATLEERVEAAGRQEAITFHGYLSGGALLEVMESADVGVVPMYPESQVAVPYKACDYLSSHLPLVNSLPGELESKLSEYGCGRAYQSGDSESLMKALRPWLESPDALADAKAGAGRLFDQHFDAAKIYAAYAEWVGA